MNLKEHLQCFSNTTRADFGKRFGSALEDSDQGDIDRFCRALDALLIEKARLVARDAQNDRIAFPVTGGLGAICITAAERHVSRILTDHGFTTHIVARMFPQEFVRGGGGRPPIHAYNTVRLSGLELIVDLDADPYAGRNTGVVVAPVDADVPIYSLGFVYHERHLDENGSVQSYTFALEGPDGRGQTYMEGDTAEHLSIAAYHDASEESLCPLGLKGGATVYFGVSRYYVGSGPLQNYIFFTVVARMHPGEDLPAYQLTIEDVARISIQRRTGPPIGAARSGGTDLAVRRKTGENVLLSLADDGTLLPNDYVRYVNTDCHPEGTFHARITCGAVAPSVFELPAATKSA